MKKNNQSKKSISLHLKKETVAVLSDLELRAAAGGYPIPTYIFEYPCR